MLNERDLQGVTIIGRASGAKSGFFFEPGQVKSITVVGNRIELALAGGGGLTVDGVPRVSEQALAYKLGLDRNPHTGQGVFGLTPDAQIAAIAAWDQFRPRDDLLGPVTPLIPPLVTGPLGALVQRYAPHKATM